MAHSHSYALLGTRRLRSVLLLLSWWLGGAVALRAEPGDTHTAFSSLKPDSQPGYSTIIPFASEISGIDTTPGYQSAAFRFVATESGPLEKILVALYGYGDAGTDLNVNVVLHTDSGGKIGGAIAAFPVQGVLAGRFKGYFAGVDPEYGIVLHKGMSYWLSLEPLTLKTHVAWAAGEGGPRVKKLSVSGGSTTYQPTTDLAQLAIIDVYEPYPPQVQNPGVPLVEGQQVPGEPTGTTLQSLGSVPQAPLLGVLKVGSNKVPAILGADGKVILRVGGPAPNVNGTTILSLRDPSGGAVLATLQRRPALGALPPITAANDVVLIGGLGTGNLQALARSGDSINDPSGATIKSFTSLDGNGAHAFFLAALSGVGVGPTNNVALCGVADGPYVTTLFRKGPVTGGRSITTISTLAGAPGTTVEGRWRIDDSSIGAKLTYSDGTSALATASLTGSGGPTFAFPASTGTPLVAPLAGAMLDSLGTPGFGPGGVIFPGTLKLGPGVTAKDHNVLLSVTSGGLAVIARQGMEAPAEDGTAMAGIKFASFGVPVYGASQRAAFSAQLSSASNKSGLWYYDGTALHLLARQGGLAPSLGAFASFTNLLLPDGASAGPIFQAVLAKDAAADVSAKTAPGIWGLGTDHALHLIARAGGYLYLNDDFYGTMKSLSALTTAAGSTGAAHGVDADGSVRLKVSIANLADQGKPATAQFAVPVPNAPPE